MKTRLLLISLLTILLSSCSSSIKPEMKDEMEAVLRQYIFGTVIDKAKYKHSNLDFELTSIKEKQYEFGGDNYGTYQGEFKYTFDDGLKSVKVMGIAVFSYDCDLCNVNGCPGIFVDAIFVNGKGQPLDDSEYYFKQCDWE